MVHADVEAMAEKVEAKAGRLALLGRYHIAPRKITDDYIITETVLGSGIFGKVRLATSKFASNREFAVKKIVFRTMEESEQGHFCDELASYLSVDHPHIARLVDVYQTEHTVSLVMECLHGEGLQSRFQAKKRFSEDEIAEALRQMLLAVNYLDCHGIVRQKFTMEDFLYDHVESSHLKLVGFGFSKFAQRGTQRFGTPSASMSHATSEMWRGSFDSLCDTQSLGVIAYTLINGELLEGRYPMTSGVWRRVSSEAKDFIRTLLQIDSSVRFSAKSALAHPWILKHAPKMDAPLSWNSNIFNTLSSWKYVPRFQRAYLTLLAWNLGNKEQEIVRDYFLDLDSDHNGVILFSELKSAVAQEDAVDDIVLEETFKSLGNITGNAIHYSDFLAALMSSRINDLEETLLQSTFCKFDKSVPRDCTTHDSEDIAGKDYVGMYARSALLEADSIGVDGHMNYSEFLEHLRQTSTSAKIWEHIDVPADSTYSPRSKQSSHILNNRDAIIFEVQRQIPKHVDLPLDDPSCQLSKYREAVTVEAKQNACCTMM